LTGLLGGGDEDEVAFAVSSGGTAVYLRGRGRIERLVERGLDGTEWPVRLDAGDYLHPRFSPSGRHIAYEQDNAVWIYDRETGAAERFIEGFGSNPTWSADGSYLYYSPSNPALARRPTDRTGEPETIHAQDGFVFPLSASPSGSELVVGEWLGPERGMDLSILSMSGDEVALRSFLRATHHELAGEISPDGAWIAYASNESGDGEVYVRRLADATGQVQVSRGGVAAYPAWAPDGGALYYGETTEDDRVRLTRVPVTTPGGGLTVGTPEEVLLTRAVPSSATFPGRNWDLSPDGTRIVFVVDAEDAGSATPAVSAEIVVNWFEELRALAGG
jgi:Tol biopolymer transport system component